MSDSITRLFQAVQACRHDDPSTSRTARLLRSGRSKMAKKLAEEAVEVVIDAMNGDRDAVVKESADLIYNLPEARLGPDHLRALPNDLAKSQAREVHTVRTSVMSTGQKSASIAATS